MTLGGLDLSIFSFIEGQHPNSNIGLLGMCDLPARTGKTSQSWAESRSVEPYVDADEIMFGGRDLKLIGFIDGKSINDTEAKNKALITHIDTFTGLVPYVSEWGSYMVKVGTVETTYVGDTAFQVLINMREPVVEMTDDVPGEDSTSYGIDRISFGSLGGDILKVTGDIRNRPQPKQEYFTSYQTEGYQITKTEAPRLDIEMYIEGTSYADFKAKIERLQAVIKRPGTRLLSVPNNTTREFFVTEGFKVTNMIIGQNYAFGLVTIKAIELFDFDWAMSPITDNGGNYITDNYNNKIYVRD